MDDKETVGRVYPALDYSRVEHQFPAIKQSALLKSTIKMLRTSLVLAYQAILANDLSGQERAKVLDELQKTINQSKEVEAKIG